jgi:hypothetical protein
VALDRQTCFAAEASEAPCRIDGEEWDGDGAGLGRIEPDDCDAYGIGV